MLVEDLCLMCVMHNHQAVWPHSHGQTHGYTHTVCVRAADWILTQVNRSFVTSQVLSVMLLPLRFHMPAPHLNSLPLLCHCHACSLFLFFFLYSSLRPFSLSSPEKTLPLLGCHRGGDNEVAATVVSGAHQLSVRCAPL